MLARNFGGDDQESASLLKVMNEGYPVVSALAMLSAKAIAKGDFEASDTLEKLTPEAKMLLLVARVRGTFAGGLRRDRAGSFSGFSA